MRLSCDSLPCIAAVVGTDVLDPRKDENGVESRRQGAWQVNATVTISHESRKQTGTPLQ